MAIGIIAPGGMRSDRRRGTGVPLRTALLRAAVGAVAIACWSQQEAYAGMCPNVRCSVSKVRWGGGGGG